MFDIENICPQLGVVSALRVGFSKVTLE